MFTKAVARLEDARAYTDPRLIEVLQEILGHCSQALEHRGDVDLPGLKIRQEPRPGSAAWLDQAGDVGPTVTFTNIVQGAVKWSQAVAVPREVGGEWRVAVKAMDDKKRMLQGLITLHGQQYFAGPDVPRDLLASWMESQEGSEKKVNKLQQTRTRTRKRP